MACAVPSFIATRVLWPRLPVLSALSPNSAPCTFFHSWLSACWSWWGLYSAAFFVAVFGSLFCGWACPFGFLQDLVGKVPTPKFDLPSWTGHLRYVVLIGTVLAIPYFFGEGHPLFVCRVCPAGGLEAAVPTMAGQAFAGENIVWPNALKLTIVALFVIAVFFVKRPWCRILCPLGAIFSLFNRVSAFFLRLNPDKCTDCERCHKLCEFGIEPEKSPNDLRCVRCLECTNCGPGALTLNSVFQREQKERDKVSNK